VNGYIIFLWWGRCYVYYCVLYLACLLCSAFVNFEMALVYWAMIFVKVFTILSCPFCPSCP
jgi:hypothetical protein